MALNRILVKLAQKLILKYLQVRYPAGANRYEDVADTWFLERVSFIPYHMCRAIKPYTALTGRALDFGCGEGIMALGMRLQNPELEVVGVDLHDASKYLLGLTQRNLGLSALPGNLSFHQIADDEELSRLVGREFSTVYSWSVFEHVSRRHLPKVVEQLYQVTKLNGVVFVQISPLYYSPYGSHLTDLVDQPWAHLLLDRSSIESLVLRKQVSSFSDTRKNLLFNECSEVDFKKHMLREFDELNKITCGELVNIFEIAGFLKASEKKRYSPLKPPAELVSRFGKEDLTLEEVELVFIK